MPNVTPVGYSDDAADELLRKHEQLEKEAAVAKRAPDKPAQPTPTTTLSPQGSPRDPTAPRQKAEPVAAAGQAAPGKQGWLEWAGSLVFGEAEDDDLGEKAYQASKRQDEQAQARQKAEERENAELDARIEHAKLHAPGEVPLLEQLRRQPHDRRQSVVSRGAEGVGRGILGSTAATLSGIKWIDDYFGLDSFVGRGAERGAELLNQRVQESLERLSGAPNFGDRLAEGFGSMAVFLIPGAGTAAGAARIAAIAPRLARIIGSGTMALTEALAEAGETYQELLDQGVKPDEAAKRAGGVFVRNTVVLAVTNKLGIFAERGSRATRAGVSALMEGVQEAAQYELQRRATGRAFDVTEMTDAALIGAIVGGSVGGVVGPRLGRTREAQPEGRPTAPEPQAIEAEAAPAPAPAFTPVEQRAKEASARGEAAVRRVEDLAAKPVVPQEALPGQGEAVEATEEALVSQDIEHLFWPGAQAAAVEPPPVIQGGAPASPAQDRPVELPPDLTQIYQEARGRIGLAPSEDFVGTRAATTLREETLSRAVLEYLTRADAPDLAAHAEAMYPMPEGVPSQRVRGQGPDAVLSREGEITRRRRGQYRRNAPAYIQEGRTPTVEELVARARQYERTAERDLVSRHEVASTSAPMLRDEAGKIVTFEESLPGERSAFPEAQGEGDPATSFEEQDEAARQAALVDSFSASLDEENQEIFARMLEGEKPPKIAAAMGKNERTVRRRVEKLTEDARKFVAKRPDAATRVEAGPAEVAPAPKTGELFVANVYVVRPGEFRGTGPAGRAEETQAVTVRLKNPLVLVWSSSNWAEKLRSEFGTDDPARISEIVRGRGHDGLLLSTPRGEVAGAAVDPEFVVFTTVPPLEIRGGVTPPDPEFMSQIEQVYRKALASVKYPYSFSRYLDPHDALGTAIVEFIVAGEIPTVDTLWARARAVANVDRVRRYRQGEVLQEGEVGLSSLGERTELGGLAPKVTLPGDVVSEADAVKLRRIPPDIPSVFRDKVSGPKSDEQLFMERVASYLSAEEQQIYALSSQGFIAEEIAKQTGTTESTVQRRLRDIRELVAVVLEKEVTQARLNEIQAKLHDPALNPPQRGRLALWARRIVKLLREERGSIGPPDNEAQDEARIADAANKAFGESAPQAETRALAEIRQFLGSASLDPQHRRFAEEVRARLEGLRDSRARGADVAAPERAAELDEEARGAINDVLSLPGLDPARAARLGAIKQELERRSPPALGSGRGGRFVRALLEAGRLRLAGLRPLGPYMEVLRSDLEGARATIQQRLRAIADQVETAPAEQLNVEEQNLDALTRWLDKLQADPSRARYQHLHVEPSGKFDIGSFAEMHERRVELATRGKLTVETIREKAAAIKPEWRDNDHSRLRKVVPGEALPAEDILAINDLLVDVGAVVQNAAREARKANYSDESVRKFGDALALFQELDAIRRGPQAEAGRSVRILQDESAEANRRFLAQFEKYLADTTEQPQAREQLVDLIASMKDPAQIQAMVDKMQKRGSWGRAAVDLWVQGLLSGLQTHIVNPVSNVAFLGWLVGERFVGEQFGRLPRLVGEEAGVAPGETIAMLDGIFDAIGHLATHMQKEKASAMAAVKTELPSVQPDEKPTYFGAPQGVWNSNWVTRGAFYMTHWPGAALGLQDTFARAIAKNAELSALQYREAYRRTAKRDQERKAAGEARMSAREREAYLRERLVELRDETPKSMEREADEFKAYATFTNELTGFMKRLEDLRNSHPLARIAVPFLRTPTNLALRGAGRLLAPVSPGLYKDLVSGDPAKRDRAGGILGASAIFYVLLLKTIAEGLLTGRPPEDPDLRRQWEKAGWKEYSFDVGRLHGMLGYPDGRPADQLPRPGDLVSYSRLDPFASIVGAAVDLWNAAGHLKNGELDALALALGNATVDNFVSETWVHGAAKFLGALNRPAQWKNFADDFVVSVVPNIARQFGRAYQGDMKAFDREVNNFRDWWDNVRARVPGLNAGMESELDLFGNKVLLGGGFGRHFGPEATYWLFDTVSPFHLNTADKPTQRLFEIFRVNEIQVRTAPITINSIPLEHVDRNNIIRLAGGKTIVVNGKTIGPATVLGMTMPKLLAELMTDKTPAWLEAGQGRGGTRQALVNRQVDRYYTEAVKVLANADPAFAKRLAGADIRHLKGRQAESAKQIKEYIREEYNLPSISVR